jgi:phosphoserine phosphatase/membrane protease YdiL (CAAX protease family)
VFAFRKIGATHGPRWALLGLILIWIGSGLVFVVLGLSDQVWFRTVAEGDQDPLELICTTGSFLAMGGLVGWCCRQTLGGTVYLLGHRRPRWPWLFLLVPAMGPASGRIYVWAQAHLADLDSGGLEELQEMMGQEGLLGLWVVLNVVILAPVVEEWIFRGWLFSGFQRSLGSAWAIGLTTVLFCLVHVDPLHILATVPLGLALGWVRGATGSVWPCVAGHMANNLLAVAGAQGWIPDGPAPTGVMVAVLCCFAGAAWRFRAALAPPPVALEPGRWDETIRSKLEELLRGPPGLACFDWDNTCATGDIGEELLRVLDDDEGSILAAYEAKIAAGDVAEAYADGTRILGGRPVSDVEALCEQVVASSRASGAHVPTPEIGALMEAMRSQGWEVFVVSASPVQAVRIAARSHGVPEDHVIAMACREEDGRLLAEIEGEVLYGAGKVQAIRRLLGRLPDFAAGDAATDREMLLASTGSLLVGHRSDEMNELAAERGWLHQPGFDANEST